MREGWDAVEVMINEVMNHFLFQVFEQFRVGIEQLTQFLREFGLRARVVRVFGKMDGRFVKRGPILRAWQKFLPDGFIGREGRFGNIVASERTACLGGQKERERWRERVSQLGSQSCRFHSVRIERLFPKIGNRGVCGNLDFIWRP